MIITRAWIAQHAAAIFECHFNMGDRHVLQRRVVDRRDSRPIGLSYTDTSYKRTKRNGQLGGTCQRTWHVASHAEPIATLDEALEILAIVRAADEPDFTNDNPNGTPAAAIAGVPQQQETASHA